MSSSKRSSFAVSLSLPIRLLEMLEHPTRQLLLANFITRVRQFEFELPDDDPHSRKDFFRNAILDCGFHLRVEFRLPETVRLAVLYLKKKVIKENDQCGTEMRSDSKHTFEGGNCVGRSSFHFGRLSG